MAEFEAVLKEDELAAGVIRAVEVNGEKVLVSRAEDGRACAISAVCTHEGGPLAQGRLEGDAVACPWHGARFDLCSGEVLRGFVGMKPLRRYEARVADGVVEVRPA